jgi:lipopolysaccharide/colanic/teichoic acid biosynthesis glycosyltransferase
MHRANVLRELSRRYRSSWTATQLASAVTFWRYWVFWFAKARTYELMKRVIDVCVAMLALTVLSPLLALIAIAIKITDRGPVFYRQRRAGKDGELFVCHKFRSMHVDADKNLEHLREQNHHGESVTFKMKQDPRVTRVGRILRRTSLDELPQLWCVVTGHMSLVGPRPAPPYEVSSYSLRERKRLTVRPGITCIWQVSGRGDVPFNQQVEMDIRYIEQRTLLTDVTLLLRTIPAVVTGKGAY